jgi:predicted ABC-type ATPase
VLAGPNGAGKSTLAPRLLRGPLRVTEYVDADAIARTLPTARPERAGITAGRVMLARLHELASRRASFGFETTLASRSFAPWIRRLIKTGYGFGLVFLWLPTPDVAVRRVAERVRMGGHDVPQQVVRRRYRAGLANFFRLYQPMATAWRVYDNSLGPTPRLVAAGHGRVVGDLRDPGMWRSFRRSAIHET